MEGLWLTFAYSWMLAAAYYFLEEIPTQQSQMIFGLAFMWIPGLIALYCSRKEGKPIPFKGPLGWGVVQASLWPIAIVLLTILFSLPWGTFDGFSELKAALPYFQNLPEPLYSIAIGCFLIVIAIAAGCTLNALAALGEELMWRGYLYNHYQHLTPWKRDLRIGFWWGLWHAPVILMGHNYPEWPLIGVFAMIVFCMVLSPLLGYLRDSTGTVIAPAIFHGTLNAAGPLPFLLFAPPQQPLIINTAGLAGILAIATWLALRLILWPPKTAYTQSRVS